MDKHTRNRIASLREAYRAYGWPWLRIVVWSDGAVTGYDYRTRAEARADARMLRGTVDVAATYVVRT